MTTPSVYSYSNVVAANADRVFFTADQHFGHGNILGYEPHRQHNTIGDMDDALIDAWNSVVGGGDIVYHLGDLTLSTNAAQFIGRLNGHIRILGLAWHHDGAWLRQVFQNKKNELRTANGTFVVVAPIFVLKVVGWIAPRKFPITLSHYPMAAWEASHYGAWHLHGHSHGRYQSPLSSVLDVGVDSIGYAPISLTQVRTYFESKGWSAEHE